MTAGKLMGFIAGFIGLVLLLFGLCVAGTNGYLYFIPSSHDERLVGSWQGTWNIFYGHKANLEFRPDGTARVQDHGPVVWGTREGVLYIKYKSAGEGWGTGQATYKIGEGGRLVTFDGKPSVIIPSEMRRR